MDKRATTVETKYVYMYLACTLGCMHIVHTTPDGKMQVRLMLDLL